MRSESCRNDCVDEAFLARRLDRCLSEPRQVDYTAICIMTFLLMLWSLLSVARAQEGNQIVATGGLNEFDLALFCGETDSGPLPGSRFGYATSSTGVAPEFSYITSRYYVQKGPNGDPQGCAFKRYLYRLDKGELFRQEEIDEKKFTQIENGIRSYARTYEKLNPGKRLSAFSVSTEDSVGGCLFPISWYAIESQDYALLSTAAGVGIVNYVIPQYERRLASACRAWGERHLTNSSITSSEIGFLSISSDKLFVESKSFQTGFLFKPGLDFQCVRGVDAFTRHILISRRAFDLHVRPGLEDLLLKNSAKLKPADPKGEPKVLPFADSVFLNQEFAAFVVALANEKGCK
jgi:hypothetical protein